MKTLIVKGVIAAACMIVPSEVFANGNPEKGKPEDTPVEKPDHERNNGVGNKVSVEARNKDNGSEHSVPQNHQGNANPIAEEKRSEHVPEDPTSNEDSASHKPENPSAKKSVEPPIPEKVQEKLQQTEKQTVPKGNKNDLHKARNDNLKSSKSTDSGVTDKVERLERETVRSGRHLVEHKGVKQDKPSSTHGSSQPFPEEEPVKDAPIVLPSNPMSPLSKTTGHGDGHSTSSGNGFTLYGLLILRAGPLVTLDHNFHMEERRAHNQWTNAPPSPPPRSILLSTRV